MQHSFARTQGLGFPLRLLWIVCALAAPAGATAGANAVVTAGANAVATAGANAVATAQGFDDITPVPICVGVPNGSFQNGFTDWTLDPSVAGFGENFGTAQATIQDLTDLGLDPHVACLDITSTATWVPSKPSGAANQAQMSISRKAIVRGRYLRFQVIGGFEFEMYAHARIHYDALVVVTNQNGERVECPVLEGDWAGQNDCPTGLQALGIIQFETLCCDLFAGGIALGDQVEIEVIWSAMVVAPNDCDAGLFFGTFCVDDFQFCQGCLQSDPLPLTAVQRTIFTSKDLGPVDIVFQGSDGNAVRALERAAHVLGVELREHPPR